MQLHDDKCCGESSLKTNMPTSEPDKEAPGPGVMSHESGIAVLDDKAQTTIELKVFSGLNSEAPQESPTKDIECNPSPPSPSPPTERDEACRVCQCQEPDRSGETALKLLGIVYPSRASYKKQACKPTTKPLEEQNGSDTALEAGSCSYADSLIELGCSCKNDLSLAHYSCALRWFASRGSLDCEICGKPALNISLMDKSLVISALKERDALQAQSTTFSSRGNGTIYVSDPPSMVAVTVAHGFAHMTREQLLEATHWFDPLRTISSVQGHSAGGGLTTVRVQEEAFLSSVNPATKWAIEGTGILIATGLLSVTITWLIAPRVGKWAIEGTGILIAAGLLSVTITWLIAPLVGKGVARKGMIILLGGLCALSVVVFLRFVVLPRIKYGPARYWAILLVFWFLVFGVWASNTRNARSD